MHKKTSWLSKTFQDQYSDEKKKTTLSFTGLSQIVTKNVLSTFLVCLFFFQWFSVFTPIILNIFTIQALKKTHSILKPLKDIHSDCEFCLFISVWVYLFGLVVRMKPKVNGQNDSISGYVLWCRGSKCKQILDYPSSA